MLSSRERLQWQPRKGICIFQSSISPPRAFAAGWWLLWSAVEVLEQYTETSWGISGISQQIQNWVVPIIRVNTSVDHGKPLLLSLWDGQMTVWMLSCPKMQSLVCSQLLVLCGHVGHVGSHCCIAKGVLTWKFPLNLLFSLIPTFQTQFWITFALLKE